MSVPRKEFVIFEESAHLVPYEEIEKFHRILIHQVRPLALEPVRRPGHTEPTAAPGTL